MPTPGKRWMLRWMAAAVLAVGAVSVPGAQQERERSTPAADAPYRTLVNTYCLSCHNSKVKSGGLELDAINTADLRDHADAWEKVVRKLRARQMPPQGARRPDEATHTAALAALETALDGRGRRRAKSRPHRYLPPAEPHRIPQRDSRSACARHRRRGAAAERFGQLRVRQHHGRQPVADAARKLCRRGGKNQPARRRQAESLAGRFDRPPEAGPDAGDASRRASHRHARRRAGVARLPRQRRIRHHDSAVARSERTHRRAAGITRDRVAARRSAAAGIHHCAALGCEPGNRHPNLRRMRRSTAT